MAERESVVSELSAPTVYELWEGKTEDRQTDMISNPNFKH